MDTSLSGVTGQCTGLCLTHDTAVSVSQLLKVGYGVVLSTTRGLFHVQRDGEKYSFFEDEFGTSCTVFEQTIGQFTGGLVSTPSTRGHGLYSFGNLMAAAERCLKKVDGETDADYIKRAVQHTISVRSVVPTPRSFAESCVAGDYSCVRLTEGPSKAAELQFCQAMLPTGELREGVFGVSHGYDFLGLINEILDSPLTCVGSHDGDEIVAVVEEEGDDDMLTSAVEYARSFFGIVPQSLPEELSSRIAQCQAQYSLTARTHIGGCMPRTGQKYTYVEWVRLYHEALAFRNIFAEGMSKEDRYMHTVFFTYQRRGQLHITATGIRRKPDGARR